jgi:hypothetical protein
MIKKPDSTIAARLRSSANKAEVSTGNATQLNTPAVKKRVLKLKEKKQTSKNVMIRLSKKTSPNLIIILKQKAAKIAKPAKPPKHLKRRNIYDED